MCDQHLRGEHVEMHMFVGCIRLGKSIAGYLHKGLVEIDKLQQRHDELAKEMKRRGNRHASPLLDFSWDGENGRVDVPASYRELLRRCEKCRCKVLV